MKRVYSIILAILMLISVIPAVGTVFAEETYALSVNDATGTIGEKVTVEVSLQNPYGFGGMAYDVIYDNTVLKPISYEVDLGSNICTDSGIDTYPDKINFQYAGTSNITGDGALVRIDFEIIGTTPGKTEIEVVPEEGTTFYYDGRKEIDFDLQGTTGTVTIETKEIAPFGFAGHQVGENGIRFIGYTNSLEYDTIDLAITVEEAGKSFTKATKTVYTTLMGTVDGETKAVASCDPEAGALVTLDYDYLYGYAVTDIEAGEYVFTIVPTATLNGETLEGKTATLNVTVAEDGSVTVIK